MTDATREQESQPLPKDSGWLLPFLPELSRLGPRILELGCGPGRDAATLLSEGFEVVAFDRTAKALAKAQQLAPAAQLLRADLGGRLPFAGGSFDAAISSLAMHYLPWDETRRAFAEVRRVLRPDAAFLFRVNASDDVLHGAGEGEEFEPGFFRAPSAYFSATKRFFDEAMVRAATEGLFEVRYLEHKTIHRYEDPKRVWECLGRRLERAQISNERGAAESGK